MEPVIREIEIPMARPGETTASATRKVIAGVYGHVAVHRNVIPGSLENHRTLTHVGTGFAIVLDVDRSVACAVAEQLGADPEWDFKDLEEFKARRVSLRAKLNAAMKRATRPAGMPERRPAYAVGAKSAPQTVNSESG